MAPQRLQHKEHRVGYGRGFSVLLVFEPRSTEPQQAPSRATLPAPSLLRPHHVARPRHRRGPALLPHQKARPSLSGRRSASALVERSTTRGTSARTHRVSAGLERKARTQQGGGVSPPSKDFARRLTVNGAHVDTRCQKASSVRKQGSVSAPAGRIPHWPKNCWTILFMG